MTNVVPLAGSAEARDPLANVEAEAALLGALLHSNSSGTKRWQAWGAALTSRA